MGNFHFVPLDLKVGGPAVTFQCLKAHCETAELKLHRSSTPRRLGPGFLFPEGEYRVESIPSAIGFLTVRVHQDLGFVGGLLVVNPLGRPLEFYCTLPVKPTRAQEILYGSTLEGYLSGEQIGRVLLQKAKSRMAMLVTDAPAALGTCRYTDLPVVWIEMPITEQGSENRRHWVRPSGVPAVSEPVTMGGWKVMAMAERPSDATDAAARWQQLQPTMDLPEPFGRIEEALGEANPSTKAA